MPNTAHSTQPPESPDDLLDTPEAAAYLGDVPPATLKFWRSVNRGPKYTKMGRHVRYLRSDLKAYIKAQTRCPGSKQAAA